MAQQVNHTRAHKTKGIVTPCFSCQSQPETASRRLVTNCCCADCGSLRSPSTAAASSDCWLMAARPCAMSFACEVASRSVR